MSDVHDLLADLTDRPATPDPVARVALAIRQSRRRRRATTTVTVAALAVGGYAGVGLLPGPDTPRPPAYSAPVVHLTVQERLAAAKEPCRTQDLRTSTSRDNDPSLGESLRLTLTVRNEGTSPCEITNQSPARILDEHGQPLPTNPGSADLVGYAQQPALQPGETSTATATWDRWCGPDPGRWTVSVDGTHMTPWLFTPPAGVRPPTCHPGPAATTDFFALGRWRTRNQYGQPTDNPAAVLTVDLRLLTPARRAHLLNYRVTLTNHTTHPVTLPTCPNYVAFASNGSGTSVRGKGVNTTFPCTAFHSTLAPGASFSVNQSILLNGVPGGAQRFRWRLETADGKPAIDVPLTVTETPKG